MADAHKKPYHHGDLRDALLNAAEQALEELPLEKVSLREIARRAGVSHAAPKHHFGTLGGLLGDVVGRGFERFVESLEAAASRGTDQSAPARLRAMARAYLRFASENRATYGLMFGQKSGVERTPRAISASMAAWQQLESEVAAVAGPKKAVHGALMVWSSCHGLAMLLADQATPPHIDPNVAIEDIIRIGLAGLSAEQT